MTTTPYIVTIRLAIGPDADAQLQSIRGIEHEITSWLSDLGADVQEVTIEPTDISTQRPESEKPANKWLIVLAVVLGVIAACTTVGDARERSVTDATSKSN